MSKYQIIREKEIEILKKLREEPVEQCFKLVNNEMKPCSRAHISVGPSFCTAYAFPAAKWRNGDCPLADEHLRNMSEQVKSEKVRVGQQKSKKKSRGK